MKKKKIIIPTIIIVIVLISSSIYYMTYSKPVPIYSTPTIGDIKELIEESGELSSKNINTYYSNMSQVAKKVYVEVGQQVTKGDPLVEYDTSIDLEIEKANKQLEALNSSYNEAIKGADFEQISNIKLNISTLETNLNFAKEQFEITKKLYEEKSISEVEYKEASKNISILENQLKEAKNNYNLLIKDVSPNIKSQYEAQIQELLVYIQMLNKNKEDSIINSNLNGVVTELNVTEGSMTTIGLPVVQVEDTHSLCVYLDLLTEEALKVKEGMTVRIYNDDINFSLDSLKATKIYPKALSKISDLGVNQKRIRIQIDVEENTLSLPLGTELDAEIVINEKLDALLIEDDLVYRKEGKEYVIVSKDGQPIETEVLTGIKQGDYVEILEGLTINDSLIVLESN